jgi:hypothetical protein
MITPGAGVGDEPGEMGDALPLIDLVGSAQDIDASLDGFTPCVLLQTGEIQCSELQVGVQLGWTVGPPIDLGFGRPATAVRAGSLHWCALLNTGQLKCWGSNYAGQLGLGDRETRGDDSDEMGENLPEVDLGEG